jgi:putative ABC transport system permease protein
MLLSIFATIAVGLSAIGIYGVMSYTVTQRTHEIGLRMALGARTRDLLKLIVGSGMTLTLAGVVIGAGASLVLTRAMKSLLFGISPTDLWTHVGGTALLALVSLLACYLPARRASRVDPMVVLRCE